MINIDVSSRVPSPASPGALSPDDERWAAVSSRDLSADGSFVYAVRTTGVYCRPSCPSRRPSRVNVRFFADADAARAAGFRPCRRCAPDAPLAPDVQAVAQARQWLDQHLDEPVTLEALAAVVGLSRFHLQRTFKRLTGVSPREYVAARRQHALRLSLKRGEAVTAAIYDAGYSSGSRVYEQASGRLGMTPGAYRRGGDGERVAYDIVPSRLGLLLVAATSRGVCFVAFGDREDELAAVLTREYPRAERVRAPGDVRPWVGELVRRAEGDAPRVEVPLDVRATAFQWAVWRALAAIPPGETRSYRAVAESLGHPGAARAVARACATNPAAVAVPCHRVVRDDGQAGGYRWGPARKAALLAAERAHRQP
jgi:AraC family transcriptional regulator of adaptative response/methylated-DNA-[protein]-cysteine methyltransferase